MRRRPRKSKQLQAIAQDLRHERLRWKIVYIVLAIDMVVTPLIFINSTLHNGQLNETQRSLSETQKSIIANDRLNCLANNERAESLRTLSNYLVAVQRNTLALDMKIPGLATGAGHERDLKNLQDTVDAFDAFLKDYPKFDCSVFSRVTH